MNYYELVNELAEQIRDDYQNGDIDDYDTLSFYINDYIALNTRQIVGHFILDRGFLNFGFGEIDEYIETFYDDVYELVSDIANELND